jgi:hypothetical protein
MTVDDDVGIRIKLVQAAGNLAHRNVHRALQAHQRHLLRLADVQQDERLARIQAAFHLGR